MYRYYDYLCPQCGHEETEFCTKGEQPETLDCPICCIDDIMVSKIGAPAIMKASFPDGTSRGDKWALAKESANLDHLAAKAKKHKQYDDAKKMTQEAKKLARRASTKRDKDEP
jgi:hypothetical protein